MRRLAADRNFSKQKQSAMMIRMNHHRALGCVENDFSNKTLRTFLDHALAWTSRSLEFGDLALLGSQGGQLFTGQLPSGEQAAAMPPGFSRYPAQEEFGLHTLYIGLVGECVIARCRDN